MRKSEILREEIKNYILNVVHKRQPAKIVPFNIAKKMEKRGWTNHQVNKSIEELKDAGTIIVMETPKGNKGVIIRMNEIKKTK